MRYIVALLGSIIVMTTVGFLVGDATSVWLGVLAEFVVGVPLTTVALAWSRKDGK